MGSPRLHPPARSLWPLEREHRLEPADQLDPDLADPGVRRLLDAERESDLYIDAVHEDGKRYRERLVNDPRVLARRPPLDAS